MMGEIVKANNFTATEDKLSYNHFLHVMQDIDFYFIKEKIQKHFIIDC